MRKRLVRLLLQGKEEETYIKIETRALTELLNLPMWRRQFEFSVAMLFPFLKLLYLVAPLPLTLPSAEAAL